MSDKSRTGPLAGIRVLDLGTMVAGPVAATLLGDFGAEVIKVEDPGRGDPIRNNGPACDGEGLWWNVEGRNKRSITINLRDERGQRILRDLTEHADILIENFRPGTMAKWGLSYDALKTNNPRLIMVSISGYGQTGPYAHRAAYDRIALAFSGLLGITGFPDRPPVRPGTAVADYQSALMGAFAAMIALFHRDARGGTGQHIDVSLFESVFRFSDVFVTAYDKLGIQRERRGNLHFAAAPGDHFLTRNDRYLVLTVSSDGIFKRLCQAMDMEHLLDDERFTSHPSRWEHVDEINKIVADWILSLPETDVCELLDKHGLAFSIAYSAADIVDDPHYQARGTLTDIQHPRIGKLKIPSPQPRLSETPAPAPIPAPDLGVDTADILESLLSISPDEVRALKDQGVL